MRMRAFAVCGDCSSVYPAERRCPTCSGEPAMEAPRAAAPPPERRVDKRLVGFGLGLAALGALVAFVSSM